MAFGKLDGVVLLFCPNKKYTSQPNIKLPGAQIASPGWELSWVHKSKLGSYSQNSPLSKGVWSSPSPLRI